jgi:hypothetical protein
VQAGIVTQVTLATSGSQADVTGLVRLTVTDPAAEVASVGFYLTGRDKRRTGPLAADRTPSAGEYEKDVLLDARVMTRVEPEVVLMDGTVLRGQSALLGVRFEPISAVSGRLTSVSATPQARRIDVAAVLDNAVIWKCYARKGAAPTADGLDTSPPSAAYLRFQSDASSLAFWMTADPGTWKLITLGYNPAGQPGPIHADQVEVTA